ncbi:Flagellin assembly [Macleaya cordata]|uniref:Flagellin assembly n=1 Tax=Macleaya cordata TaxID=56857 RepID=A0A200RDM6_MACCD|nr:Flagellin assembly [Macleaya cordata]
MGYLLKLQSASTNTRASTTDSNIRFFAHPRKPNSTYLLNLPLSLSPKPFGSINFKSSPRVLYRFNLICRTGSFDGSNELNFESMSKSPENTGFDSQSNEGGAYNHFSSPSVKRPFRSAAWIGAATAASKFLGLLREILLAAVFGVGPVATAFKHASVLPCFYTSVLGGVNGPIHITMATTLSKLSDKSGRKLIQNTLYIVFLMGGILGALVFMLAESIIYVSAPGLWILTEGQITREIAISQCLIYLLMRGGNAISPDDALFGGLLVSAGASLGVFLQWLIQVIMHEKTRCCFFSISWMEVLKDKDVHKFFELMLPAILISGMAQIASFTDLYFASFIPGAAAGLSYAHLLAMAPLGVLSSTTVLPLIPTFSKLAKPSAWPMLMENLKQAILLCTVIVLPVTLTMCVLAEPVISVLFQRFTFGSAASALVSSLLICYSIGSPFYIVREMLVVVFYALGDGQKPFLSSVAAIIFNAFLDWLLVSRFYLGAQGLALSTSLATALSALLLLYLLSKKLNGFSNEIEFVAMVGHLLQLLACCIISGLSTKVSYKMLRHPLSSVTILRFWRLPEILSISMAASIGMCCFYLPLTLLHFPGMNLVKKLFKTLIN